jgi:CBS domain-containing protein
MPFFFIDHNGLKHPSDQLWEYYGIRDPDAGIPADLALRKQYEVPQVPVEGEDSVTAREADIVAKDIMTTQVVTLFDDQKIQEAIVLFEGHNFRHLPVISRQGVLVGLLSERDIIKFLHQQASQTFMYFLKSPVNAIMQKTVLTVSEDTELQYIVDCMRYESIGSLPVLGEAPSANFAALPSSAEILGIITKSNLLPLQIR